METSKSRLKEFRTAIDATNEWMDETEKLLKSFNVGMDPEEASKLQEKAEVSELIHHLIMSYWASCLKRPWVNLSSRL